MKWFADVVAQVKQIFYFEEIEKLYIYLKLVFVFDFLKIINEEIK
ncbi:hypothetical protein GCM10008904_17690 [Paraclostridium ghonii]